MPLRARHADVEEPTLLGDLVRFLRLADRQLALLDPRDEDGLELEPLRAVQCQQVDALPLRSCRAEALLQLGDEVERRADAVVELRRELHEPAEVRLAHALPLAALLPRPFHPACVMRIATH